MGVLNKLQGLIHIIQECHNWPTWVTGYLGLRPTKNLMTYAMRNGTKICTRDKSHDRDMISEVWGFKKYFLFGYTLPQNAIVIDIGGHIGTFSLYAASNSNAKCYIYEPHPGTFKLLQRNIRRNHFTNTIIPFNMAVAGDTKTKKLFIDEHDTGGHSVKEVHDGENYIATQCTTIAEIFKKNKLQICDYLKMDCEGVEYEIFFGMPKLLLRKLKIISMEYHDDPQYTVHDLVQLFKENGFSVKIYQGHRLYARNMNY